MVDGLQDVAKPSGDPIGPGFFRTLRNVWGTRLGRRTIIVGIALVVASVVIVIGLVIFSAMSRQSQSYRDGYSVGGEVYAADAHAQLGAQQACRNTERSGQELGGLPVGDDPAQWLKGCAAAFEAAQSGN